MNQDFYNQPHPANQSNHQNSSFSNNPQFGYNYNQGQRGDNLPQNQYYQRDYSYDNNSYYNNHNSSYNYYNFQNYNNFEYKGDNSYPIGWGGQNQNSSVSYEANIMQNSFNNSFASQGEMGVPEVGRFGGAKKKKKQKNNTSFSSNAQSSNGPKVKQPSTKEESTNEFYFPTHTQTAGYVECPFNSNHIMEQDRLLTHINRCKLKSENAKYFSVCPYEPCHYFYTTEIEAHILVCEKRSLFVVNENWDDGVLNNSTTLSLNHSVDSEVIATSSKAPSSKFENEDKRIFQQLLIDP